MQGGGGAGGGWVCGVELFLLFPHGEIVSPYNLYKLHQPRLKARLAWFRVQGSAPTPCLVEPSKGCLRGVWGRGEPTKQGVLGLRGVRGLDGVCFS